MGPPSTPYPSSPPVPPAHGLPWCLQVHAAVLRGSNKDVVIKVLKPGVEDVLTTGMWGCGVQSEA